MASRRVTFVVHDKKLVIIIPEETVTAEQMRHAARNFQYVMDEDCSILYDAEARTFRLTQMAASHDARFTVVGHARVVQDTKAALPPSQCLSRPPASPHIPRPPNAWIIYRSQKSKEIRKELPHATAGYISTVVSRMWKLEPRETRLWYNAKAIEAHRLHKEMYPGYKYNANKKTK
ncbi:hypothetical protein SEUCBS139899_002224 [Sporothrix eucalyptigena]|uniref:HMG box domain-containing protein n=1 Tax=Sporothrix eucalyptigena TaxID=1812306 RepID=A0ABP0BEE2_9PEZI